MSTLKVDTILKRTGTGTITLGQSGDTLAIPSGVTIANSGTATGFPDNGPAFNAYVGTMSGIPNQTSTVISASTEVFDSDGKYDTSNYRFTPGVTGKYVFFVSTKSNQMNYRMQVGIFKNGSIIAESAGRMEVENHGHGSSTYTGVSGSQICICDSVTDYFQAFVWQNTGGTATFYNNQFQGFRLAGL